MHKFILTIIVPIYNTEKYIEKCLNSIDPNNNKYRTYNYKWWIYW